MQPVFFFRLYNLCVLMPKEQLVFCSFFFSSYLLNFPNFEFYNFSEVHQTKSVDDRIMNKRRFGRISLSLSYIYR